MCRKSRSRRQRRAIGRFQILVKYTVARWLSSRVAIILADVIFCGLCYYFVILLKRHLIAMSLEVAETKNWTDDLPVCSCTGIFKF